VSQIQDWKQKYRDSLLEMEAEETRWRQIEQALRRLVGRLCAAGMGVNPQLDDELVALAAANRRNAPAEELEQLAGSLTTTIVAVDAVSPVITARAADPRAARWDATCTAVGAVLLSLKSAYAADTLADQLLGRLPAASNDAELAAIVGRAADLIRELCESLARERQSSASMLSDVTARLGEMAIYLTETGQASRTGFEDTSSFNHSVMSQVRELCAEVDGATELSALQSLVNVRLETVSRHITDFRAREEARREEQTSRSARMHARIADLERETQELCRRLDDEKQGARLDPLTRLANRKSFEERFAEEMKRRADRSLPVAMLLWDIDDFKLINDSYGHRAGDRVLQTVASCLLSGLRAEDFVARIGGEEFVVIMTGQGADIALRVANELRAAVQALRFHFRGTPVRVTVSCGVTELRHDDAPETVFDRADAALYRAKREGKNLCIAASSSGAASAGGAGGTPGTAGASGTGGTGSAAGAPVR
jgi:diguanylate cyclase